MDYPNQPEFYRAPSVADAVAFDALPEETRAIVARLFGKPLDHQHIYRDLVTAYEKGWRSAWRTAGAEPVPTPPQLAVHHAIEEILAFRSVEGT